MMMTATQRSDIAQQRVAKGVRLLNAVGPSNWRDEITEDFDIQSLNRCVLGEVFGSFGSGCRALRINTYEAWEYGFDIGPPPRLKSSDEYDELQAAWEEELS